MKKLDDKAHGAICRAMEPLGTGGDRPKEWFIFRFLAHALSSEGAARKRYLTEFADYLERFLKQDSEM